MSEYATSFQALGGLGGLCGLMALRMSMFRLAGSPGESDSKSPMNRFSEIQLLNAEWAPVGGFLILANILAKGQPSRVNLLALAFVLSRLGFASKSFMPSNLRFPVGFASMLVTYLSTLGLSGLLLLK